MTRQKEVTRFVSESEKSCISRLVVGRVVVNSEGIRVVLLQFLKKKYTVYLTTFASINCSVYLT